MNFLHNYIPQPIFLQLGPLAIRWYGLLIALAMIVSIMIAVRLAKRKNLSAEDLYDLAFWLALSGIIGARLYDVLVIDWKYYCQHLSDILKIWQGGLAIHGAILGGALAVVGWSKIKKIDLLTLTDLIAPVLALAQAIGRWGNYFNQELFGRPTDLPWGIPISPENRPLQYASDAYFHPAFLYESIADFLLFALLVYLSAKNKLSRGTATAIYFIGYGLIRFMTEFIRIDATPAVLFLRWPQWVSVGLIVLGTVLIYIFSYKREHDMN